MSHYVNILLLGNSGAGRSSLGHVIAETAAGFYYFGEFRNVHGGMPYVAGIIFSKIQHKIQGNIILHDSVGHSEYYSSHGTVIENILRSSAGIFLIVINILQKEAIRQLHQWLQVVRNKAQMTLEQCQLIVVVSHVDAVGLPIESRRRKEEIREMMSREICDVVFLDCRKLGGRNIVSFLNKLSGACKSIHSRRKSRKDFSLYCHMMYGLLEERKVTILTLSDLMSAAAQNTDNYALLDKKELLDILRSLDSTGLISLLKSKDNVDKVWVVVDKEKLLMEINCNLFASKGIASNTGIVSASDLTKLFPCYDLNMLICFLKNMEVCQEVKPSLLKLILLSVRDDEERDLEGGEVRLLFFPCLLWNRPDNMTSQVFQFGWCLQCTREHDFFPPHYFHALS